MRAATLGAAVILAAGLWTTAAAADETAGKKGSVHTLDTIKITARPPRPAVAVDVARVLPRAPLPALQKPLLDRIGAAVERAPF